MDRVITVLMAEFANQIQHNPVFVVIVRIFGTQKDLADKRIQPVIIDERALELDFVDRNRVEILAVDRVKRGLDLRAVHGENIALVTLIGVVMGLDPLRCDFLNRGTVIEFRGLEDRQRVVPGLRVSHDGKADAVDKRVQELIVIAAVHRLREITHRFRNVRNVRLRHTLLEIIRPVKPNIFKDGRILFCHVYSLIIHGGRQVEGFDVGNVALLLVLSLIVFRVLVLGKSGLGKCGDCRGHCIDLRIYERHAIRQCLDAGDDICRRDVGRRIRLLGRRVLRVGFVVCHFVSPFHCSDVYGTAGQCPQP